MSTNITPLRRKIAELQAERRDIEGMGRSRAEVRASIESFARGAAASGRQRLDRAIIEDDLTAAFTLRDPAPHLSPGIAPLLAALLGADALAAALCQGLDDLVPEGMPPDARRTRLAEIAAELDKLETAEEAMVSASEARGEPIARRPDCRPEIVLALPPSEVSA